MGKSLEEVQAILEPEIEQYLTSDADIELVVNILKEKKEA